MTDFYKQMSVVRQKWEEEQAQAEIQCGHTTEEIEKSFIEDVKAVKEQLPNGDCDNDCEHCAWTECPKDDAQADGDLISRQSVIDAFYDMPNYTFSTLDVLTVLKQLPSVAIPTEHDGCKDCKHENKSDGEYPCSYCKQNYKDMWEREKPTDTITMTREEFSEKLMEHYRQGRADEKAYQNGEIMQSFNPD